MHLQKEFAFRTSVGLSVGDQLAMLIYLTQIFTWLDPYFWIAFEVHWPIDYSWFVLQMTKVFVILQKNHANKDRSISLKYQSFDMCIWMFNLHFYNLVSSKPKYWIKFHLILNYSKKTLTLCWESFADLIMLSPVLGISEKKVGCHEAEWSSRGRGQRERSKQQQVIYKEGGLEFSNVPSPWNEVRLFWLSFIMMPVRWV